MASLAALLLLCGASACLPAPNEPVPESALGLDWPTLLGGTTRAPDRDEAVPDSVVVAWREHAGRGLLAPVVVKGEAIFAALEGRAVVAIATATGKRYWQHNVDDAVGGGIVLAGDSIFVATNDPAGEMSALAARTGREAWSRGDGGSAFTPLVSGDTVYFASERHGVVALRRRTGERLWRAPLPASPASTPVPFAGGVVVAAHDDSLYALSGAGAITARADMGGGCAAAPAVIGDTLLVPLQTGELAAFRLPALEPLFRAKTGAPILASPAVAEDGSVYLLDSSARVWRIPPAAATADSVASLGGAARQSLALVRNGLLVGRLDGTLFFLRRDGSQVWQRSFKESIVAPATVSDGAVYVPLIEGTLVKLTAPAASTATGAAPAGSRQPTSYSRSRSP